MIIRRWFPALSAAALALMCLSADRGQAGSFFGPTCYGSAYTNEYPNRSHNAFGCGPGSKCTVRHPLFKHRWFRKNQEVPVQGAAVESMQTPIAHAPFVTSPVQGVTVLPAPFAPAPVVSNRIAPIASPLPSGPVNPVPTVINQTSKPPF